MTRWQPDADEFTVSVTYHKTRGCQGYLPKPVMERSVASLVATASTKLPRLPAQARHGAAGLPFPHHVQVRPRQDRGRSGQALAAGQQTRITHNLRFGKFI